MLQGFIVKILPLLLTTAFVFSFVFNPVYGASQATIEDDSAPKVLIFRSAQELYSHGDLLVDMVKSGQYREALEFANVRFEHPDAYTKVVVDTGRMETYEFQSTWAQAKSHLNLVQEMRSHYQEAIGVIKKYEDFCVGLFSNSDVVNSNITAHKAVIWDMAGDAWRGLGEIYSAMSQDFREANQKSIYYYERAISHANGNPDGNPDGIQKHIENMHLALIMQYEKALQVQSTEERSSSSYLEKMSGNVAYLREVNSNLFERAQKIMEKFGPTPKLKAITLSIEEMQCLEDERIAKSMEKLTLAEKLIVASEDKNRRSQQRARENAEKQRASAVRSLPSQVVSNSPANDLEKAEKEAKAAKLERHNANLKKKTEANVKKRS